MFFHADFGGDDWYPSWDTAEDLGGDKIGSVTSASWGDNRLDLVGLTDDGTYVHKAWTGDSWFPEDGWEDFGGYFFSEPAVVSWGAGRLDIIGLSADDGTLRHLYYQDGWSSWEDLGGGPFIGNPVATSWGPDRLDFWAIDSEGELNHLYWDGSQWSDWEQLGGEFTSTPKVVHWNASKIDIVGKGLNDDKFHLKSFDGSRWNPDGKGWFELAGPFESEPELVAKNGTSEFTSGNIYSSARLLTISPRLSVHLWYRRRRRIKDADMDGLRLAAGLYPDVVVGEHIRFF